MKKLQGFIVLLFFSTILLYPALVLANPVPVDSSFWRHIGLLPIDPDVEISMVDADVLMKVDARVFLRFRIKTEAEYTFYNHEETQTITVILPFDSKSAPNELRYSGATDGDVNIEINDKKIEHQVRVLSYLETHILDDYVSESMDSVWTVVAFNVTFEGNSNTTLFYSSTSSLRRRSPTTYVNIHYTVSTGRVWYGNLTEKVTFSVRGLQPDRYLDYSDTPECIISSLVYGKSYSWYWENCIPDANPFIVFSSIDYSLLSLYVTNIVLIGIFVFVRIKSKRLMKKSTA